MASRADELPLDDPAMTEAWLKCFSALSRSKKLKDSDTEKQVTDLFIAKAGMNAIRVINVMAKPKELEDMKFSEIKDLIMEKSRPKKKLVIAERSKFMSLRQEAGESVQIFAQRLRDAARFCEFDKLNGKCEQTAEDDLIQTMILSGLKNREHRTKALVFIQGSEKTVTLAPCIEYIQQIEMIQRYTEAGVEKMDEAAVSTELPASVASVDKNRLARAECRACGIRHQPGRCPARGKACNKCHKRNHFAAVCRSNAKSTHEVEASQTAEETETGTVFALGTTENKSGTLKTVTIEGRRLAMQLDSGSDSTIIPRNFWQHLGEPKLRKCNRQLRQFDGTAIRTLGTFTAVIELDSKITCVDVTVAACSKNHGLLGTDSLQFDLDSVMLHHIEAPTSSFGKLRGFKARILLKDHARPSYFEARSVPIHLKPMVVQKLRKLIEEGVLEPVPPGGSRWASPIVVVRKPDGDLRICSDYKVGVNPKICADSYPLPSLETAFCELAGMSHFATIDLANAYNQLELDEAAREILTINTPIGLLRWTRLPYGVKTASAQFQAAMEATIGNIATNLVIYQDDVCVGARTGQELDAKVARLLSKLKEKGMRVNEKKCVLRSKDIRFLGYRISADGVRPDSRLVDKVLQTKAPTTRKELESFVGLTNYYSRYVRAYSERVEPLTALRSRQCTFKWGLEQQRAFDDLKKALAAYPVIQIFDPAKHTTVTTDASENAVSAILSQDDHPILYLSRRLTKAERNYSNIEREALAVVWATQRARHFLLGSHFSLNTDHQPLEFIFNPSKELPKMTSARIMRWAIQLAAFDFDIAYVRGNTIPHVDALSRLQFEDEEECDAVDDSFVHWTETDTLKLSEIQQATEMDPVLKSVMRRIKTNVWSNCSVAERPYKSVRQQLTVDNNVLCRGDQVVLPAALRNQAIRAAHDDTHSGALATRNRLKREAWWPGHCEDIERFVRMCPQCVRIRAPPARSTHSWPLDVAAWERVHIDHAHVAGVGLLLIVVDAFSGWPEAMLVKDKSARTTVRVLRSIFSRLGVPKTLVSDNAPEFCDGAMRSWLQRIGCAVVHSPPYHPQSNGCAERMVQTIKCGLRAFVAHSGDFEAYLAKLLLNYRSTARSDGCGSPSALMGRQLRSPLTIAFGIDAPIIYQARPGAVAEQGRFVVQAGHNTAVVTTASGRPVLAHRDQIRTLPTDADLESDAGPERFTARDDRAPEEAEADASLVPEPVSGPRRSGRCNKGVPPLRYAPCV